MSGAFDPYSRAARMGESGGRPNRVSSGLPEVGSPNRDGRVFFSDVSKSAEGISQKAITAKYRDSWPGISKSGSPKEPERAELSIRIASSGNKDSRYTATPRARHQASSSFPGVGGKRHARRLPHRAARRGARIHLPGVPVLQGERIPAVAPHAVAAPVSRPCPLSPSSPRS